MKRIMLPAVCLLTLLSTPALARTECPSDYPGIAIPRELAYLPDGMYGADRVCFRGRDITDWAAGAGLTVTSAIGRLYGRDEAIITTATKGSDEMEPGYRSQLVRVYISAATGMPARQVLANQGFSSDPKESIDSFKIAGFDQSSGTIYSETPAWATSNAIHAVKLTVGSWSEPLKSRHFAPGQLVAPSGKPVCEVDSSEPAYRTAPKCGK